MSRFAVTIEDDGSLTWHSVDTGKTRVLAMDENEKLIVIHIAGHMFWSSRSRSYAPSRTELHRYEDGPSPRQIYLTELFGIMSWQSRGNDWRPRQ